jgi:guanosine-3',5'-bis(diphosphate) 3'-pyrophosphohydrolase
MTMTFTADDVSLMLKAVKYSAEKHQCQRRKGASATPYINHPIAVAEMLWRIGGVRDTPVIVAAILHDTVEDTDATPQEIELLFGCEVRELVAEVTDDKSLLKEERKCLQVEHAPHLSPGAKQIKLADKIANVSDIAFAPPRDWSYERRTKYLLWSDRVVAGLRGCNAELEAYYDAVIGKARASLDAETRSISEEVIGREGSEHGRSGSVSGPGVNPEQ